MSPCRFNNLDGGRFQATTVSQAAGAPERSPAPARPGDSDDALPSTASPMPFLALMGLAALAGAQR